MSDLDLLAEITFTCRRCDEDVECCNCEDRDGWPYPAQPVTRTAPTEESDRA